MIENAGEPLERVAVKDGVPRPVVVRWGQHPGPRGFPRYELEVDGPIGTVKGEADDLWAALQVARRKLERGGWMLAVEGSRLRTHPSGMQRDMAGGRVAYRLGGEGDGPLYEVGILEPADVADCVTVVEQERWYQNWVAPTAPRPSVLSGRGWIIVNADLGNGRVLNRPVVDGGVPVGGSVVSLYTDRIFALAAGDADPFPVKIARVSAEFPGGFKIDPGQPWATRRIPVVLAKLPRLPLGAERPDARITGALPGARVFDIPKPESVLVVLPAGADLTAAADALAAAVGGALIPPLILVVAGAEPAAVRRALKGRA